MIEVQETQTPQEETQVQSQVKSFLRETLETLVLTAIIFFAVNFMTGRFKIYGASMDNSFQDGQYIIVSRLAYLLSKPQRGDVIVFVPPGHPEATFLERLAGIPGETDFIKRIIGLPGDTVVVSKGNVSVNGIVLNEPYIKEPMRPYQDQTWTLGPDQYFMLGDNRNFSKDSRDPSVGPISLGRMIGKVWVVYWPLPDWKLVSHYRYP
ncbi:MAG: signal peptidase I [Chloroflexi bacterium]|nr:signal peptidase I [Chloroflexota bacterium]